MYDYFDIYVNYGENRTQFLRTLNMHCKIKCNTFSESLYFVLFNYLMTK